MNFLQLSEELENKHAAEAQELESFIAEKMKGVKKSGKKQAESECIQLRFDLKARHYDEFEALEETESSGEAAVEETVHVPELVVEKEEISEKLSKQEKAKRKKDRKSAREQEKQESKEKLKAEALAAGDSPRELELQRITDYLGSQEETGSRSLHLKIKEMTSDGHCLFRSIADQLSILSESTTVADLRTKTANHMRAHATEYLPFIGNDREDALEDIGYDEHALEQYCKNIEQMNGSIVWGGQLELRALCESLERNIWVYQDDANTPVLKMGNQPLSSTPLRVSYHRHFYALGEHYNSVVESNDSS